MRPARAPRILVAEDDRAFALFARFVLVKAGCKVDLADGACDAMELLLDDSRNYDAVVVDTELTDAEGCLVACCAGALRPNAAILVVSDYKRSEPPLHDVWLEKPYQPGDLVRALTAANSVALIRRLHGSHEEPLAVGAAS